MSVKNFATVTCDDSKQYVNTHEEFFFEKHVIVGE